MENKTTLRELLLERIDSSKKREEEIDRKIWKTFGKNKFVLISDMSGFSRLTKKYGILHFLSLIVKQHEIIKPVIEKYNGFLVKHEADNFMVTFDSATEAIDASFDIHRECIKYNKNRDEDFQIKTCHGLSYGEILVLEEDIFGDPVNIASKLGEDTAEPYETLITDRFFEELPDELREKFVEKITTISSVDLKYFLHRFNE